MMQEGRDLGSNRPCVSDRDPEGEDRHGLRERREAAICIDVARATWVPRNASTGEHLIVRFWETGRWLGYGSKRCAGWCGGDGDD